LEELGVDGGIILKWIFTEIGYEGVDRTDLAQDGKKWRSLKILESS
jgi:hypothetical protein